MLGPFEIYVQGCHGLTSHCPSLSVDCPCAAILPYTTSFHLRMSYIQLNNKKIALLTCVFLANALPMLFLLQNDSSFLTTIHDVYLQVLTKNTDINL